MRKTLTHRDDVDRIFGLMEAIVYRERDCYET